ncbi:MAG: GNAT family N-acetyltransferase [Solirubrobacterales bacterium]
MNTTTITVLPMSGADLEAVIALDHRITGQSRRGFYTKQFAATRNDPDAFIWLVAILDGNLAGFISTRIIDGEFGGTRPAAVVEAIGTHPELRGHGVARALMSALERRLAARNVAEIHSEADWKEIDLVRFFAASGFQLAPNLVLGCNVTTEL